MGVREPERPFVRPTPIPASFMGHPHEVRILLAHKCDPSFMMANGGNAADAAHTSKADNHVKSVILDLLQQYGGYECLR